VSEKREPPRDGYYYHSIDVPGHGVIVGAWDLRANTEAYLGGLRLAGKRVLEFGAANGFLSFHMERAGADVVPFDLSPDLPGDVLAYPGPDYEGFRERYPKVVAGLNRAWWWARESFDSRLELSHGTAYAPPAIGEVDISVLGSILLHLRDPYQALFQAAQRTREAIVVTELFNAPFRSGRSFLERALRRLRPWPLAVTWQHGMIFNPTGNAQRFTWWSLSPGAVQRLLLAVGFPRIEVTYHQQTFRPGFAPWGPTRPADYAGPEVAADLFTVVGWRK
jgi:hypothetical protein